MGYHESLDRHRMEDEAYFNRLEEMAKQNGGRDWMMIQTVKKDGSSRMKYFQGSDFLLKFSTMFNRLPAGTGITISRLDERGIIKDSLPRVETIQW